MIKKVTSPLIDRRLFLTRIVPAGTAFCFGCSKLFALVQSQEETKKAPVKHKFQEKADLTFEQIFRFAFAGYIARLAVLAEDIGKDKFIDLLKKSTTKVTEKNVKEGLKNLPNNDFATLKGIFKNNPMFDKTLTFKIVEDTDSAFELKVTECLWAKTVLGFGVPNAGDFGFAAICYGDYASARAFNPKLRMVRDKTLMQGHECCNHRYIFEA
jgi:hypothetical protein